jgi:hypothetical protein
MLNIILGVALFGGSAAIFWHLLPRNGQVHPLVERWDGSSTITIVTMTVLTFGVILVAAGLAG